MAQQNETAHNSEYETLRTELLSLREDAFKAWRWGLLELATLTGVVVAQVVALSVSEKFGLKLEKIPEDRQFWGAFGILSGLYLLGLVIGLLEARTTARLEKAADRIGGFLAVFHDLWPPRAPLDNFGWHIWNRIEKVTRNRSKRIIYFQDQVWFYVIGLIVYFVILAFLLFLVLDFSLAWKCTKWGAAVGAVLILVFSIVLIILRNKSEKEPVYWTRRWHQLAKDAHEKDDFLAREAEEEPYFREARQRILSLRERRG